MSDPDRGNPIQVGVIVLLLVGQVLVAEDQYKVFVEVRRNFGEGVVRDVLRKVDAGHFGPHGAGDRFDLEMAVNGHGRAP